MNGPFLGEALILTLLIFNCARFFFLKYGKVDSLAVLAPISLALTVLQILAWGIDLFTLLLLALSILAFFTNFRACLRLAHRLYIDYYSVAFKIGAVIVLIVSVFELCLLIYFRPVRVNAGDCNVSVKKTRLAGSFSSGFFNASPQEISSANMWVIQPARQGDFNGGLIALFTDKRADVYDYAPYTFALAKKGFRVYAVDFYARDLKWFHTIGDSRYFRRFFSLFSYFKNPVKFELEKEFYTYNSMQEMNAVLEIIRRNESVDGFFGVAGVETVGESDSESKGNGENTTEDESGRAGQQSNGNTIPPLFIGDWMAEIALSDFEKLHKNEICGIFNFTNAEEYATPGFGFIEQTRPFTAYFLGKKRNSDLKNVMRLAEKTAALVSVAEKVSVDDAGVLQGADGQDLGDEKNATLKNGEENDTF